MCQLLLRTCSLLKRCIDCRTAGGAGSIIHFSHSHAAFLFAEVFVHGQKRTFDRGERCLALLTKAFHLPNQVGLFLDQLFVIVPQPCLDKIKVILCLFQIRGCRFG